MTAQAIHLKVRIDDPDYFEALLITFFPYYEHTHNQVFIERDTNRETGEVIPRNFCLEYYQEPHFQGPHREGQLMVSELIEFAKIKIQQYPSFILVSFEKRVSHERYFEYETSDEDWDRVGKVVQDIIFRAKQMEFEITVVPDKPMTQSTDSAWLIVEDHGADRLIAQLWYEKKTSKDIAMALGRDPRTITNTLSRLRGKYGEDAIPTNEQRWKRSQETKDNL